MLDYRLNPRQLAELRAAHRAALNVREAYRLNAVILLAEGWTAAQVGQALLLDPDSVRTYFKRYQQGGLDELLRLSFIGSEALLICIFSSISPSPRWCIGWKSVLVSAIP